MIIETIVRDYLAEHMNLKVCFEVEDDMPDRYVLIEKVGGGEVDHIKNSTLAIQSIAPSKLEACMLNEVVKDTMKQIISIDSISKSSLNSDYDYTLANAKSYRYQAVFDVYHY